jgi:hypothetical protein
MKSFKINDGKVKVDGVLYGPTPINDVNVMGKTGRIHSINISGRGQFFPIGGMFDDGSVRVVDSTTDVLDSDGTFRNKKKRAKSSIK